MTRGRIESDLAVVSSVPAMKPFATRFAASGSPSTIAAELRLTRGRVGQITLRPR